MGKVKISEALLSKKIFLLKQKYKQQKKEERILMKKNKKLVNEFQSHKNTLKSLNDERLALQKDIYDKKYGKAVSEGNNITLKNSLSSFLNDLHALQTKVINSWKENQKDRNRHSSKKLAESCPQESMEEQTVSEEEPNRQSRASSPVQHVSSQQDDVLVCKIEALNALDVKPVLPSQCDGLESKQELSILLSSFCRRDTVPLNKISGPDCLESENVPHERTCESECQESTNMALLKPCKTDFQNFKNVPLNRTCVPDSQESENKSLERTCEPDHLESANVAHVKICKPYFEESGNVLLEVTCEPDYQKSENVLLLRNEEPDYLQSGNEAERSSPQEEPPFYGFVEDQNEKRKFTEIIERLSVKRETLESLRNYEIGQSLTIFESNPEIAEKEAVTNSTLEVDLSRQYKIQKLEVSIPRLDLSAYPSLNSTIEILKKDVSRGRKSIKSNHSEEENQRNKTPDSTSESPNKGHLLRRGRNAVNYKENLRRKLRRS